jgi:hypothetical protein
VRIPGVLTVGLLFLLAAGPAAAAPPEGDARLETRYVFPGCAGARTSPKCARHTPGPFILTAACLAFPVVADPWFGGTGFGGSPTRPLDTSSMNGQVHLQPSPIRVTYRGTYKPRAGAPHAMVGDGRGTWEASGLPRSCRHDHSAKSSGKFRVTWRKEGKQWVQRFVLSGFSPLQRS